MTKRLIGLIVVILVAAAAIARGQSDPSGAYSGVGACGSNNWASTLNAAAAPTCTQPGFSSLFGAATDAQVPDTITIASLTQVITRAISDTTGTLTVDRGGTGAAPGRGSTPRLGLDLCGDVEGPQRLHRRG